MKLSKKQYKILDLIYNGYATESPDHHDGWWYKPKQKDKVIDNIRTWVNLKHNFDPKLMHKTVYNICEVLVKKGILSKYKYGASVYYSPTNNLKGLIVANRALDKYNLLNNIDTP